MHLVLTPHSLASVHLHLPAAHWSPPSRPHAVPSATGLCTSSVPSHSSLVQSLWSSGASSAASWLQKPSAAQESIVQGLPSSHSPSLAHGPFAASGANKHAT